jgi:DNA-binding SARP family transcriptional activator
VESSARTYRILGPLEVEVGGVAVELGPPKQRSVLAVLLVHADRVVSVDSIIDELWGDEAPPRALGSLQAYISNLRRVLDPNRSPREPSQVLVTRAPGYSLRTSSDTVDATVFEALAISGRRKLDDGQLSGCVTSLKEALALWRGPALADFEFELFTTAERSRLDELRAGAEEDLAEASLSLGKHQVMIADLERLTKDAPFRERRWELLMLALYRSGRQAHALRAYAEARETFADQLGIDPSPRLQNLESQILRQEQVLDWRATEVDRRSPPPTVTTVIASLPQEAPPDTPIVGRQAELSALEQHLTSAGGKVITVAGDPGIGKTTLVEEVARRADALGFCVALAQCPEVEGAPPLWPWVKVFEALGLSLPSGRNSSANTTEARAAPASSQSADAALSSFEFFHEAAGVLLDAVERPTLVILEDVHWADNSSLGVLRTLSSSLQGSPLVVIVTFRQTDMTPTLAETVAALARTHGHHRLQLEGFDAADVAALASQLTDIDLDVRQAQQLQARTNGNAFFVVELIKLLSSQRRLTEETADDTVPTVVGDVIGARVARLPDDAQTLLSVAAVCGRVFDIAVVCAATEIDEESAIGFFETAIATGILTDLPEAPGRCQFCHALVQETLYGELSTMRRARLHHKVAQAIEEGAGGDPTVRLAELAYHFGAAISDGATETALGYACRAAEQAMSTRAHHEAAAQWARALVYMEKLGSQEARQRYDMLFKLGTAERLAGDAASSRRHLAEAAEVAIAEGDYIGAADAAIAGGSALVWNWTGTYGGNPEFVALLEAILAHVGYEPRLEALLWSTLAAEHATVVGERMGDVASKALSIARSLDDPEVLFAALNVSFVALQKTPQLRRRRELADEMVSLADSLDDDRRVVSHIWRFLSRLQAGEHEAVGDLESAAVSAAKSRQPALEAFVSWNRSLVALLRGPMDVAEQAIEDAQAGAGFGHEWDGFLAQMFMVRWMRGELGGVAEMAEALIAHAAPGMREAAAMALASAGRIDEAYSAICGGSPPNLPPLMPDYTYAVALCVRAEAVAISRSADLAHQCSVALQPFAGQIAVINAAACMGAVDFYRARLASTLGHHDDAVRLFGAALALNEGAGAYLFAVLAKYRLGEELIATGSSRGEALQSQARHEGHALGMGLPSS